MRSPLHSLLVPAFALALAGCSSGPFEWRAEFHDAALRVTFETRGANTFSILGQSCDAPPKGECSIDIPTAELPGGWAELPITTRRRTARDNPKLRLHFGENVFPRPCRAELVGGQSELEGPRYAVTCDAVEGFRFSLGGRPMDGNRGEIPLSEVLGLKGVAPTRSAPVVPRGLPIVVHNRGQGQWPRPLDVAVAPPLAQFRVEGWEDPWFEPTVPLRIRVEPGATLSLDGAAITVPADGGWVDHVLTLGTERQAFTFRSEVPGKAPVEERISIEPKSPLTPLHIDEPAALSVVTTEDWLPIRGRTHPDAVVFLGRQPITVAADGSFSVQAPLEEGQNDVEIVAEIDGAPGRVARPRTTRAFSVLREPKPRPGAKKPAGPPAPRPFSELASNPASAVGERVAARLRVEDVASTPTEGGCRTRIEGLACAVEGRGEATIGFESVGAWACMSGDVPVVVEYERCPDLPNGQWVLAVGELSGILGGRRAQVTVARPVIAADFVEPFDPVER